MPRTRAFPTERLTSEFGAAYLKGKPVHALVRIPRPNYFEWFGSSPASVQCEMLCINYTHTVDNWKKDFFFFFQILRRFCSFSEPDLDR